MKELRKFIKDQLSVWPLAAANYRSLKSVRTRELTVGGLPCRVQFNPERAFSTNADTRPEAIAARPCFLCADTRRSSSTSSSRGARAGCTMSR